MTHRHDTRGVHYEGPERRRPTPAPHLPTFVARAASLVLVVLVLWATMLLMVRSQGRPALHSLLSLTHSMCGALLLISAALTFAYWRSTHNTRAAYAAVALTTAGLSTPLTGILARGAASGLIDAGSAGALTAVIETAVIGCVAAAVRTPVIRTGLTPFRYAVPLGSAIAVGAGFVLARGNRPSPALVANIGDVLRAANVAGWLVIAVLFLVRGLRQSRIPDMWLAAALVPIACSAAAIAAMGPVEYQLSVVAAGFDLCVAASAAAAASVMLWRLHSGQGSTLLQVSGQLYDTRVNLADLKSSQSQRLHDARNAIFAIAGAVDILTHSNADPSGALPHDHLQRLITAELNRLGHLLDPAFHGETTTFSTAEMLRPLVAAYRAQGMTISDDIDGSHITGRRDLIAGAVTNILTNARVHAPGARMWVTSASVYDAEAGQIVVRIDFADDGPGIPHGQYESVLHPGVRGLGVTVPGSGLGLASAAQSLAAVGGTLRLSERPGGGTVVTLKIPADTGQPEPKSSPTSLHESRTAAEHVQGRHDERQDLV